MKRYFLIVLCFLLTGCLGDVGKGILVKNCSKSEKDVNTSILVKSREGKLESLVITEVYSVDVMNSKMSEKNLYSHLNGIVMDVDDNKFVYSIDVVNADDLVRERFHINDEQYKQLKYYEDNGFTCK